MYGTGVDVPWEFNESTPSRSYAVLYLVYGPLVWLNKYLSFEPISLLYLARIQLALSFFIIAQVTARILCKTRQENSKALFFIYTSYVTWTYQSHTFSNSVETQLLLIALSLIHLQKQDDEFSKNPRQNYLLHILLAIVCSVGIFNRITFFAFLLLPGIYLLKHYLKFKLSLVAFIAVFLLTSYLLALVDSSLFNSRSLTITPLNNLIYNSDSNNLAKHGLHPRFTHILINLPQLIGPSLIPFIFRNHYKNSIPYLSIISGLLILSIIPHQELRFLAPLVPLICICTDFTNFESPITVEWILRGWCLFNVTLGLIMGSFHQRGVLDALVQLKSMNLENTTQLWWKTYSPPTWLLGNSIESNNKIVDLMGMDLNEVISKFDNIEDILFITSKSSIPLLESINDKFLFESIWSSNLHLDLDHFDFTDIRTFYPGIDIYKVKKIL